MFFVVCVVIFFVFGVDLRWWCWLLWIIVVYFLFIFLLLFVFWEFLLNLFFVWFVLIVWDRVWSFEKKGMEVMLLDLL